MATEKDPRKRGVLFCTCSGTCPGMAKIDFWALVERLRIEFEDQIELLALHPRLCEADGERLMGRVLSDDLLVITSACVEKRQEKLLRDGFAKAGVPMDKAHWLPVSMAMEDTEAVFQKLARALAQAPASES